MTCRSDTGKAVKIFFQNFQKYKSYHQKNIFKKDVTLLEKRSMNGMTHKAQS